MTSVRRDLAPQFGSQVWAGHKAWDRRPMMFRRALIEILVDHPMTVSEIAGSLRVPPREVEEDLRHLFKSLRHENVHMQVTPARCLKCHFAFPQDKFTKPGRCPLCHGSWISEPRFLIERC